MKNIFCHFELNQSSSIGEIGGKKHKRLQRDKQTEKQTLITKHSGIELKISKRVFDN